MSSGAVQLQLRFIGTLQTAHITILFLLLTYCTYKGHYPTVRRQFGEFLYIRKEHVENNLFVKYYMRMSNYNKVIKVLNIKSAVNLLWTSARGAIETPHSIAIRIIEYTVLIHSYITVIIIIYSIIECVFSIALPIGIHCNFIFKIFITLLKLAIRT